MIQPHQTVAKHYKLTSKLGKGAFGEIWRAINTKTKKEVAIKFEVFSNRHQQLYAECKVYLWFNEDKTVLAQAIPQVLYYGVEKNHNILIMDLLGDSLESLFKYCQKQFSMKTVLMIAD